MPTIPPKVCAQCGKPCGLIDAAPLCLACTLLCATAEPEDRERWLATSRPGGLRESLAVLERARADYGA